MIASGPLAKRPPHIALLIATPEARSLMPEPIAAPEPARAPRLRLVRVLVRGRALVC